MHDYNEVHFSSTSEINFVNMLWQYNLVCSIYKECFGKTAYTCVGVVHPVLRFKTFLRDKSGCFNPHCVCAARVTIFQSNFGEDLHFSPFQFSVTKKLIKILDYFAG